MSKGAGGACRPTTLTGPDQSGEALAMDSATTRSAPYLLVSGHTLPRAARALQSRRSAARAAASVLGSMDCRATGITIYRQRGGDLEMARQLAGHASVRTTQACDSSGEQLSRGEVERVQL
jgi:hypothetical protein